MVQDVLPSFRFVSASELASHCPFLHDPDWIRHCHSFRSAPHRPLGNRTGGTTQSPFLICCLSGCIVADGFDGSAFTSVQLQPGSVAYWPPGAWTAARQRARRGRHLRVNLADDYRLLAYRRHDARGSRDLLGRLMPGPCSLAQEALLPHLLSADATTVLCAVRYLILAATHECLQDVGDDQQARARFLTLDHHLREHAAAAPSRTEVAAALAMHPGHVSRLVRRFADCSFTDLLHRHQLTIARQLLQQTSLDLDTVARASGFSSANYFIRLFKRTHGLTPGRWRTGTDRHAMP